MSEGILHINTITNKGRKHLNLRYKADLGVPTLFRKFYYAIMTVNSSIFLEYLRDPVY